MLWGRRRTCCINNDGIFNWNIAEKKARIEPHISFDRGNVFYLTDVIVCLTGGCEDRVIGEVTFCSSDFSIVGVGKNNNDYEKTQYAFVVPIPVNELIVIEPKFFFFQLPHISGRIFSNQSPEIYKKIDICNTEDLVGKTIEIEFYIIRIIDRSHNAFKVNSIHKKIIGFLDALKYSDLKKYLNVLGMQEDHEKVEVSVGPMTKVLKASISSK